MLREKQNIVVVGSRGMLGQTLSRQLLSAYPTATITQLARPEIDLTAADSVTATLAPLRPSFIFNCAAYTDVERCEVEEQIANEVNGTGVFNLAMAALQHDALLVHISTDFVFPGNVAEPYAVDASRSPLSAYGRSKLIGEIALEQSGCRFLLVRTAWLYGEGGANFVETMLRLAKANGKLAVVSDQVGAPTYTEDLARGLLDLVANDHAGTFHCTNAGATSWHDFAREIVRQVGLDVPVETLSSAQAAEQFSLRAQRPAYSVLDLGSLESVIGRAMRPWEEALAAYLKNRPAG